MVRGLSAGSGTSLWDSWTPTSASRALSHGFGVFFYAFPRRLWVRHEAGSINGHLLRRLGCTAPTLRPFVSSSVEQGIARPGACFAYNSAHAAYWDFPPASQRLTHTNSHSDPHHTHTYTSSYRDCNAYIHRPNTTHQASGTSTPSTTTLPEPSST